MRAKEIVELAENTFTKKLGLNALHQEVAEHFYPQRADFTATRTLGEDFASQLTTSFPVICAREFAGSLPAMLRPTQKPWFEMIVAYQHRLNHEAKAWLEWATGVQRRAMYDRNALLNRALSQADNDWCVFGQAAIECTTNDARDALLHRTWHLRDMAWLEDENGNCCPIFRRWRPQARTVVKKFKAASDKVRQLAEKEPFRDVNVMHIICDAELYDGDARGRPYWSIYYDCDHQNELEAVPVWNKRYAIPRWQTVSGSQYAYSPAVVAALPEGRLLQAMTYTLLEAGEKAANPPTVATQGAVRSDVQIFAGGTTWVDMEYDEKLGEALRTLNQDYSGLPFTADMMRDSRAVLERCFYLNKIRPFVPTEDPQMTAFQAGQIVAQYIRDALPIFEPMEDEYNGQICELDFDNLARNGAFGSPLDWPRVLKGQEIEFRFQSPLHDAIEAQKGHKFLEMKQLILEAMALDRSVVALPNAIDALRDAMEGIKVPMKWMHSPERVSQIQSDQAEMAAAQQLLETAAQAGEAGKLMSETAVNMSQVEQLPVAA
jgi:hypothetical protein